MQKKEKAAFALGCSWHFEEYLSTIDGITELSVSSVGEDKDSPINRDIGNNSVIIEVAFDPFRLSYPSLLEHFWHQHDPFHLVNGKYASVIFTYGKEQNRLASESRRALEEKSGKPVTTQVLPVETLYTAGEYDKVAIREKKALRFKTSCR